MGHTYTMKLKTFRFMPVSHWHITLKGTFNAHTPRTQKTHVSWLLNTPRRIPIIVTTIYIGYPRHETYHLKHYWAHARLELPRFVWSLQQLWTAVIKRNPGLSRLWQCCAALCTEVSLLWLLSTTKIGLLNWIMQTNNMCIVGVKIITFNNCIYRKVRIVAGSWINAGSQIVAGSEQHFKQ